MDNRKITLLLAIGIDILFGDPPNRFHPVAWLGNLITAFKRKRPFANPLRELAFGAVIAAVGGIFTGAVGWLLGKMIVPLPKSAAIFGEALVLKSLFALRGLDRAAGEVQVALEMDDLSKARRLVSWHLVSRNTKTLDESGVAAATIESIAENASDSLVAPLFFYFVGGLPLASAYRFFNTADAMLGYRTPEYEWLGKIPAKLDDVMNYVPARLTALLIYLAAIIRGIPGGRILENVRRDAAKTESPNAGYPMSAMAGALNIELEKPNHYRLGADQPKPKSTDISKARNLLFTLTGVGVFLAFLLPKTQRNTAEK